MRMGVGTDIMSTLRRQRCLGFRGCGGIGVGYQVDPMVALKLPQMTLKLWDAVLLFIERATGGTGGYRLTALPAYRLSRYHR